MALRYAQVTVTSTATLLAQGGGDGEYVYLKTSADVFLGDADVLSTTGYKLVSTDAPLQVVLYGDDGPLYAVTASGSATVYVLRTRA